MQELAGFDLLVNESWNSENFDQAVEPSILLKNKFKALKVALKQWWAVEKIKKLALKSKLLYRLHIIDKLVDDSEVLATIMEENDIIRASLLVVECKEMKDTTKKAKLRWSIEGDENSKFNQGMLNRKCTNLTIKGVKVEGE